MWGQPRKLGFDNGAHRWPVRVPRAAIAVLLLLSFFAIPRLGPAQASAGAQPTPTIGDRIDALSASLKPVRDLSARAAAAGGKVRLSTGAQNLVQVSKQFDELGPQIATAARNAPLNAPAAAPAATLGSHEVSDPRHDLIFSRIAGFTQSETSTAWCGNHVVVAYNDSGSFLESFPVPAIGLSFNGWSLSTNGGRTFTDLGFVNPGPSISNFLGGDPVVVCTDQNTFYQSSILQGFKSSGVGVLRSVDGGLTWGDPVAAVLKDGLNHFIDKPWLAADPTNPKNLYVTYTDFDFSSPNPCGGQFRSAIELVASKNAGATWSIPTVVDQGCFPNQAQGSNVAVDGKGNVQVAWERFPAFVPTNEIDFASSTNGGASFSPSTVVAIVTTVGSPSVGLMQGGFRNNEFPSLAIDMSQSKGPIYVAWNDGRNGVTPDAFPPFFGNTYNFGDAFVSRSDDGGRTWSAAVKVNDDRGAANHIDHFLPGVAVDRNGSIGACWYDRRRDAQNFLIDRECAVSTDEGATWRNFRVTGRSFAASIAGDLLINPVYMGDYDNVTTQTTGGGTGFLSSYGDNRRGNPDVFISPRFGGDGDNNVDQN